MGMRVVTRRVGLVVGGVALLWATVAATAVTAGAGPGSFIGGLPTRTMVASTVPGNGDVNPYGVALVPRSIGRLQRGSVLVSNFNDQSNAQGTGTTIVEVSPAGQVRLFASIDASHLPGVCPGGVGLTTALAVLRSGWVVVGSLPTTDGTSATARAGCLLVLDAQGRVVEVWSGGLINGPWDLASVDEGGRAASVRDQRVERDRGRRWGGGRSGHGGPHHPRSRPRSPASGHLDGDHRHRLRRTHRSGGTGGGAHRCGGGADGTVYVADTANSRLAAIPDGTFRFFPAARRHHGEPGRPAQQPARAGARPQRTPPVGQRRRRPVGGDHAGGIQVASRSLDASGSPPGAGALFGLAVASDHHGVWFVDDADNTLDLLH